jgi:hypothetical protein
MDQDVVKKLTVLIDETIEEIEELKKSRYSASEMSIGDKDSGIKGRDKDGSCEKADDPKNDDPADSDKTQQDLKDLMDKGEGKNSEADPGSRGPVKQDECESPGKSNLHEEAAKAEDEEEDEEDEDKKKKKEEMDKAEGKNSEADPGSRGPVSSDEASVPSKSNLEQEAKKSVEEEETLMKSYVDSRISELDEKIEAILKAVEEIADQPVMPTVPSNLTPLHKSIDEVESLTKSQVEEKLWELKKSGTYVDSADFATLDMGGDFNQIANKYGIK